ncbi:MAG: flagellar motor switch protein FliM [Rhodanobacteraceae bacterium]
MARDELLSQDEIDRLLKRELGEAKVKDVHGVRDIRPYDPASQQRVIRERLHGLDIINQRFARRFRVSLFDLIRRSADITVENLQYQSCHEFVRAVPAPANLNIVTMKPLRGAALVVFPAELIYLVVDNRFGGDGRFVTKSEGREFTNTEQRIVRRLLDLALDAYGESWRTVYPLEMAWVRSETQAKFATITNSPNEIVVTTTFHIDVGNLNSGFQVCVPYSMIEPMRKLLANPGTGNDDATTDRTWTQRIAGKIRHPEVELVAELVTIPGRIRQVRALQPGNVLPIELPQSVTARVDGVPVLKCAYGSHKGQRALRVLSTISNADAPTPTVQVSTRGPAPPAQETNHK